MQYLVQMKLANSSRATNAQEGIAFIEQFIFPTPRAVQEAARRGKDPRGRANQRKHWSRTSRKGRLRQGTGRSRDQPAGMATNGNCDYSAYDVPGPRTLDREQAERFASQAIDVLTHLVLPELLNEAKESL